MRMVRATPTPAREHACRFGRDAHVGQWHGRGAALAGEYSKKESFIAEQTHRGCISGGSFDVIHVAVHATASPHGAEIKVIIRASDRRL